MRHELSGAFDEVALSRDLAAMRREAADEYAFPDEAFGLLHAHGVVGAPPIAANQISILLRLLARIGRGDLSVGRIYEGHVNALLLVAVHGTADQQRRCEAIAGAGGLFGVWNTDLPSDPLRLDGDTLRGAKNFASGVDGLSHVIVTVENRSEGGPEAESARQMLLVPVESLRVDRSWWTPLGMRASGSHIADFGGLALEPDWVLGAPGAYVRQPFFSGGAVRFAAVQTGGMHALLDVAVDHLSRIGRDADPYQRHRIARMGLAVETGYAWLDRAASAWTAASSEGAGPAEAKALMATANATRSVVEASAMEVLEHSERSVGAAGMIAPHPLERLIRDLRTYLRQPNPDGALAAFGAALLDGSWSPGARP